MRMVALKALRYGGRSMKAGDVFLASERHVRVLVAGKMAAPKEAPIVKPNSTEYKPAQDLPPSVLRKPVVVEPGMSLNEIFAREDGKPVEKPVVEEKPKRTYTRRDLKAES